MYSLYDSLQVMLAAHGLFGDDILITRQHFVFSEKHVICFSYKSHDFAHLCDFVTKFGYAV